MVQGKISCKKILFREIVVSGMRFQNQAPPLPHPRPVWQDLEYGPPAKLLLSTAYSFPLIIINEPGLFPIGAFAHDDVSDVVSLVV